ncbi:thioesterase [Paenibacillus profundus]|uniref:Thioesterase n=1 Tax=Paenibacillus profundus TaxID=1173085 RepID=A0ABS8YHN3_9BACL|nr:acyl-ACP thioesterase domain-containing protein [Paenibacillus profundus]MCE5170637.1 thioesterase [Paenibacillus profundus]
MGIRWRETHDIQSDNSDYKRDCRLSTLLEWMQRAADAQIASFGVSLDELIGQGMAWMLVTVDVELQRLPRYGETIEIETWSKGAKGVQWQRDYQIYGPDRELLAEARTVWVLVDLNKRRILRASAFPYEIPVNAEDSVGEAPHKADIPADTVLEHAYDLKVRLSSIDMNGHLNNARFADICLDALTQKQLERGIARFHITYHQEVAPGDEMTVLRSDGDGASYFICGTSAEGSRFFDACVVLR